MHLYTSRPRRARWTRAAAVAFVIATMAGGLVDGIVSATAAPPSHAKGGQGGGGGSDDGGQKCHPKKGCPDPTSEPSPEPTSEPTTEPTSEPTAEPTTEPTSEPSTSAPDTQGTWTSPEGISYEVTTSSSWTIRGIHEKMLANAIDLDTIGPFLTVRVQDTYNSQASVVWGGEGDRFSFSALITLQASGGSIFLSYPDQTVAHEYGHVWGNYWRATVHGSSWEPYLSARGLLGDSRLESSYGWQTNEIIADDYRLVLGAPAAAEYKPWHMNTQISHPDDVVGLEEYLLGAFRGR